MGGEVSCEPRMWTVAGRCAKGTGEVLMSKARGMGVNRAAAGEGWRD